MRIPKLYQPLLLPALLSLLHCGDYGASQGGAQDLNFARELIDNGQIPPSEAFKVEGLLSEHDLPLEGEPCARTLCVRGALGIAPDQSGAQSGWLQVGLSSTVDPAEFVRPSVTVIATVDVSGSMGWGYSKGEGGYPTPGELSRELLHAISDQLGPQDRIAIVTYGSDVDTALELTSGDDHGRVHGAIDDLTTNGSTNMEAGMERAYELAHEALGQGQSVRVMLFTDTQPNVGATEPTEFEQIASRGADAGIGITVFGLGLGMGPDVFNAISHLKGGNAFSLTRREQVGELMENSWPWMVSAIATDLALTLETSGARLAETYGFPAGHEQKVQLTVATVFLSKNRGAVLLRFAGSDEEIRALQVAGQLDYTDKDGARVQESLSFGMGQPELDEHGEHYQQLAVQKTVALALLVRGMKDAVILNEQGREMEAIALIGSVAERFARDTAACNDPSFARDLDMVQKLRALIDKNAPAGSLYGM